MGRDGIEKKGLTKKTKKTAGERPTNLGGGGKGGGKVKDNLLESVHGKWDSGRAKSEFKRSKFS